MKKSGLRFQPSGGRRAAAMPVGKKAELRIERLAHDGRGIAHCDGRTWFIQGGLPDETVIARVLAARSKVVDACCERVIDVSPARQSPFCPYAGQCGGCSLQHMPHAQQLALKQRTLNDHLQRIADLTPEHWASPLTGDDRAYRRRARLAIRWNVDQQRLDVGFRALASQRIVPIDGCQVLVDSLSELIQPLTAVLQAFRQPRRIGHVELSSGGGIHAVLLRHISALASEDLTSLRSFCQTRDVRLWLQGENGPEPYGHTDELSCFLDDEHIELTYRPGDFIQINETVNRKMVQQAIEWLSPADDEHILDLYCGIGNFALPLARRAAAVLGVEGDHSMVARAIRNAGENDLNNACFVQADLSQPLNGASWPLQRFDAVVLDPPRDGALEVVRAMPRWRPSKILYVSCDPATLARDAAVLKQQGYRLRSAGILDMFPHTAHVESMALFQA